MEIYTDADYTQSKLDRRSIFEYCIFMGGNLNILDELKVKYEGPMKLFCNNKLTIGIVHNPVQYNKTKNIKIDKYFIKEKFDNGLIVITHVRIGLQVVDVFTKGLSPARFQELNGKLRMIDIHLPT
ncbi:Copia protein, partial [Mucuna pruriens]